MGLFFDIVPPHSSGEQKKTNRKVKRFKKHIARKRGVQILVFFGIILVGGLIYQWLWAKATIEIWPETEIIQQQEEVVVDHNIAISIQEEKTIPGKLFTDSREKQRQFASTGTKEGKKKAEGFIRVYNNYAPAKPITLRAGTRFLSSSGQYFRSPESIYVPAAKFQEGELTPQWVEVKVVAMEAGDDSNIAPADFSIPGLLGTNYYDKVYAKSFEDMKGGEIETFHQVTTKDLKQARDVLEQEIVVNCKEDFQNEAGPDFIFLEDAFSQEIIEGESSIEEGVVLDQFDYREIVEVKSLAFSKKDLREIASQFMTITAEDKGKVLVPDSLNLNYQLLTINLDQGKATLVLKLSARIYTPLPEEEIRNKVKGLNHSKALFILRQSYLSIRELQIKTRPFWTKKIPSSLGRIKVFLNW